MTAAAGPLDLDPRDLLTPLLGSPVQLQVLKDKPGRRRTSRATGPLGSAVVKVYTSGRAPVVAARLAALQQGEGVVVPPLLLLDAARHAVVIGELEGPTLARALNAGPAAGTRVGAALARWHVSHRGTTAPVLREHTAARELRVLLERASGAPPDLRRRVEREAPGLAAPWEATTVVHRDLYEEQVLVGEQVGVLDLDDVARGPAELDMGNLVAHLLLRARRTGHQADVAAVLHGYARHAALDAGLLARCTRLALLRLACLHRVPALLAEEVSARGGRRGCSLPSPSGPASPG